MSFCFIPWTSLPLVCLVGLVTFCSLRYCASKLRPSSHCFVGSLELNPVCFFGPHNLKQKETHCNKFAFFSDYLEVGFKFDYCQVKNTINTVTNVLLLLFFELNYIVNISMGSHCFFFSLVLYSSFMLQTKDKEEHNH